MLCTQYFINGNNVTKEIFEERLKYDFSLLTNHELKKYNCTVDDILDKLIDSGIEQTVELKGKLYQTELQRINIYGVDEY